jgi:hypothetical protein
MFIFAFAVTTPLTKVVFEYGKIGLWHSHPLPYMSKRFFDCNPLVFHILISPWVNQDGENTGSKER